MVRLTLCLHGQELPSKQQAAPGAWLSLLPTALHVQQKVGLCRASAPAWQRLATHAKDLSSRLPGRACPSLKRSSRSG